VAGPYEIYLIRHGVAEERGDAWPDDSKRPLTGEGKSALRKAARGLLRLGVGFDVMLTSPFVRARQTAEAIAAELDTRPLLVSVESLTPTGSFVSVLADLEKQGKKTRIALVGHEPSIGELAARLAGMRRPLEFKKGAICRIDLKTLPPAGPGALRWFATPKLLRAVRKA
jgi:phosphohistidine phosphatase